MPFDESPAVRAIIGCAIAVHKSLGPGLLESAYERCLAYKFDQCRLRYQRQVAVPVVFEDVRLDCGYRVDFLVEGVLVELKSIERLLPIHVAQAMTYLKLSGLRHGLLINFNVEILRHGIRSLVNPQKIKSVHM